MIPPTEIWRLIDGWPGYEVSCFGQVRNRKGHILRPGIRSGYQYVVLCNHGQRHKSAAIHRLVAVAFLRDTFKIGLEVNHKDGNKLNNHVSNLEWLSRSENQRHAADIGLKPSGERAWRCTKLNRLKVKRIRALHAMGFFSQQEIADCFEISQSHVGKIVRKEKWRQIT